jgi:serine/threonine protein kinase
VARGQGNHQVGAHVTTGATTPRIIENRYVLDDECREGGMAQVFGALDRVTRQTVAVKILTQKVNPDERLLNLVFDRERRSLEALQTPTPHPNIVQLLDLGRDPQTRESYFVLEWIDKTLEQALRAAPCTGWPDCAERVALPVLEALAHAHERKVLHRDIKPSNVLVTDAGVPKISDFGVAKLTEDIQPGFTVADQGTEPYKPEKGRYLDSRDVYAWGVLTLVALTGIDPFGPEYAQNRYHAVTDALEAVEAPRAVRDFLAGCVSDEPDDRPATAVKALADLRKILHALAPAKQDVPVYYLALTNRARAEIESILHLAESNQASRALEDDLAAGCGLAPLKHNRKPNDGWFELFGAELKLTVVVDETNADSFVVTAARSLSSSLLEKLRERAYPGPMSFKVGAPPSRSAAQQALLDLQVAVTEHANELRAKEQADAERRVFWTWKATLRAKEQIEREREAPIKYDGIEVNGRRVTFSVSLRPLDDVVDDGRFRQVELLDGGYLGGEVYDVRGGELDLAVRYGDPHRVPSRGVLRVDTTPSRSAILRQSSALDAVLYERSVRRDLPRILGRPETVTLPEPVEAVDFVQPDLDPPKQNAIRKALGAPDMLAVQGPPGTGKTTFITELVVQFLRRNPQARVLVTSQTHAALDNVIERLAELDDSLRLVRIGRPEDPRIAETVTPYLIDNVVQRWRADVVSNGRAYLRGWAKERDISERDVEIQILYDEATAITSAIEQLTDERRVLGGELEQLRGRPDDTTTRDRGGTIQLRVDQIDAQIASLQTDRVDLLNRLVQMKTVERGELDELAARELSRRAEGAVDQSHPAFEECRRLVKLLSDWHSRFGRGDEFYGAALLRSQVVAATCLGLHSFKGTDAVEFDLCIIDEASRATATEALVPMVQAKQWILVGDPQQLPPFVEDALLRPQLLKEHDLSERDVRETMLDRLLEHLPEQCTTLLSLQHRMVPEIGDLISTCFYGGTLESAPSSRPNWMTRALEKPVVWYTTSREQNPYEVTVGTSRANNLEARVIKRLLERINFCATAAHERVSVAVLSGYLAQLTTIERQIADSRDLWTHLQLDVSSIDSFQGRECDILIYSVTRSNPQRKLGFLREERRLNVALSRARFGLILVGDHVFAKAAGDIANPFHDVIDFIERHEQSCVLAPVPE